MDAQTIIGRKRDSFALNVDEINWFCKGLASGMVSDAQAGAFAMAVTINGMNDLELVNLTLGMLNSGSILKWDLPGPILDKHSTGGVGDCVSLLLAPALASCGAFVPMVSGRGLGHTGGTLDKLEAITGYKTQISTQKFKKVVSDIGCAIVGANSWKCCFNHQFYSFQKTCIWFGWISIRCKGGVWCCDEKCENGNILGNRNGTNR